MVVVGAGLSGLTAARQVVAAGRSAIVLEARDRVGGRTLNHDLGGGKVVEVGGQWIGPTQDHLAALANDVGVGTYKTYNKGNYLFYENGTLTPYSPTGPFGAVPPDLVADAAAGRAAPQLDPMAATVPLEAPWTAANAWDWDGQTFETFKLRRHDRQRGGQPARPGNRGGVGRRAPRRLAAARPVLHPLRGQRDAPRERSSG